MFDSDGVYDPSLPNDRLLLGLKGTMSEFELTVMRRRLLDAAIAKARRGELRFGVPIGLMWEHGGKIELDPDRRVQAPPIHAARAPPQASFADDPAYDPFDTA